MLLDGKKKIIVGSRKSQLALIQSEHVIKILKSNYPSIEFEILSMSTTGDKILEISLSKIGSKALFTKELEVALQNSQVDFVVHSLKDLPTTLPDNMMIASILERVDPRDAVVVASNLNYTSLDDLPKGSVIGTSSVRRIAQLKHKYPHLAFKDIRGNLNTRLAKLDDQSEYAAIVLAYAGLQRMGWKNRITQILDYETMFYAVGQGALAVECRKDDQEIINLLKPLTHQDSLIDCTAERALMFTLEGGCSVPLGVYTTRNDKLITLHGLVSNTDGTSRIIDSHEMTCETIQDAELLGVELAKKMTASGAKALLQSIRNIIHEC